MTRSDSTLTGIDDEMERTEEMAGVELIATGEESMVIDALEAVTTGEESKIVEALLITGVLLTTEVLSSSEGVDSGALELAVTVAVGWLPYQGTLCPPP
jgi:hypothetical protein